MCLIPQHRACTLSSTGAHDDWLDSWFQLQGGHVPCHTLLRVEKDVRGHSLYSRSTEAFGEIRCEGRQPVLAPLVGEGVWQWKQ